LHARFVSNRLRYSAQKATFFKAPGCFEATI
jgi:hypothetical protein